MRFDAEQFLRIPEEKRLLVRILVGAILFFLLILAVRSCGRPARTGTRGYLRKLTLQEPRDQIDGIIGLANRRAIKAVPQIEKLLVSTDEERVRKAAAYAIFVLDRTRFDTILKSGPENVRLACFRVLLEREGEQRAIPWLCGALQDGPDGVRRFAFSVLERQPGDAVCEAMAGLVEDSTADTSLRVDAAAFLGRHGDVRMLVRLGRMVENVPLSDRSAVVEAVREAVRQIEKRVSQNPAG